MKLKSQTRGRGGSSWPNLYGQWRRGMASHFLCYRMWRIRGTHQWGQGGSCLKGTHPGCTIRRRRCLNFVRTIDESLAWWTFYIKSHQPPWPIIKPRTTSWHPSKGQWLHHIILGEILSAKGSIALVMFGLLKTLTKEQKGVWPAHLPALTFAYNATPHSTTGYQPFELMFGRKASAPCGNWLGLRQYNDDKSISKIVWVDTQFERIVQVNKRALKSIKGRAKVNERQSGDKDLDVPIGNLVLLRDHSKGHNKIQDDYKPDLFEVVGKHQDPNAFYVKPIGWKGPAKQVNWRQMFNLGVTEQERGEKDSEQIEDDPEVPPALVYNQRAKPATKIPLKHPYHLQSKGPVPIPAPRVSCIRNQGLMSEQVIGFNPILMSYHQFCGLCQG